MKQKKQFLAIAITILFCSIWASSCKKDEDKIEASPTSVNLECLANSSSTVNIMSSGDWHISSKPEWIDVSPLSGQGNASIDIKAISNNESTTPRSADLEIKTGSATAKVHIEQSGKEIEILELNPSSISLVSSANASANINIICNGVWEITSKPEWINVSSNSGKGNTLIIITALSENDSASPRSGYLEVTSGSTTATLLISQVASLESGCEIYVTEEVILNTSATFRVRFGSQASYFYAAYFPVTSAGWNDNKIIEELEKTGTPMTAENDADLTASDLNESTSYIQCFVAYNEKGKRGEVIRINFTTPSSKNAPIAYIEDVSYNSTNWFWSTKIGATSQEYYMIVYGGTIAFLYAYYLEPSDIGMIFKDSLKDLTSYVNSQDWRIVREAGEMDLLVCTWAQRDKKWSPVVNMFYGSITEESSSSTAKSIMPQPIKKELSSGQCIPHYPKERKELSKYLRVIKN